MRLVSYILVVSMVLSMAMVTPVAAATTITLKEITSQDWAIAFKDGITDYGYFHRVLQAYIVAENPGMQMEKEIPLGGKDGVGDGKADLVRVVGTPPNHLMYIWEVKPSSWCDPTHMEDSIAQLERYVRAGEPYNRKGNEYIPDIPDGKCPAVTPLGVKYTIKYQNAGNGLMFYSFDRDKKYDDDDYTPDVAVTIPNKNNKNDEDGTGGGSSKVVKIPKPKIQDGAAAFSPDARADAIAAYIVGGAATVATIIILDKYSSVKPSQITAMYLAGIITASDYLMFMELIFGTEVYAAEFGIPETLPGQDKSDDTAGGGVGAMEDLYSEWSKIGCPLTINLDGTGIETLSLNNGVYFDHQDTGFKTKTGWVAPNTGLLVRGVNENSKTISGRNLLGDNTLLKNSKLAANGFEALKDLDDNVDGIFDELDAAFFELYIWFDYNSNGEIDPDELVPFWETGIVSIDLNYVSSDFVDSNGNAFKQISTAVLEDDTVVDVIDIWFVRDVKDSQAVDRVEVSDEIKALPQIRGFGTTHSLQQAIMLDAGGQLQSLVERFVTETSESERKKLVPQIIHKWTGKTTNIAAIEALTGVKYTGGTGTTATAAINKGFDSFAKIIYEVLMSQSHYRYLYRKMYITDNADTDTVYNLSTVSYEMLCVLFGDQETGEKLMVDFITNMQTLRMFDSVDLDGFQKIFADYDYRYGLIADIAYKNIFFGMDDTNNLTGTNGNDAFISGTGNKTLNGGNGDDTFFFDKNSGSNTLINGGGNNTIILSGVSPSDFALKKTINTKNKYDVEITFAGCNAKIVIPDYMYEANYIFVFPDSSVIDLAEYFPCVEIATVNQLDDIRNDMYGNYRLVADIDLAGAGWTPIGTGTKSFNGVFDGNGHTIKNLSIDLPNQSYVGLFANSKGIISNLQLENVQVTGKDYAGGLAGMAHGVIMNCRVTGASNIKGAMYAGGIVGYNKAKTADASTLNVTVKGDKFVGGIAGYSEGAINGSHATGDVAGSGNSAGGLTGYSSGTISKSYATGNVRGGSYVGGLTGQSTGTTSKSYAAGNVLGSSYAGGLAGSSDGAIDGSYATGDVAGSGNYAGGLTGHNYGTISKSYATGDVAGSGNYAGGLTGYSSGTISKSCATGKVQGSGYVGGFAGYSNAGINNSFSTGNVPGASVSAGFVGYVYGSNKIENCYSVSNSGVGFSNGGSIVNCYFNKDLAGAATDSKGRTTAELAERGTYEGWDFSDVWSLKEGDGYPTLQGLPEY